MPRRWSEIRTLSYCTALAGGMLHTGDLGEVGPGGHLRVVGRKSQIIIRGGANVYPAEVERVLVEAPGVGACAVVGVPDERLGERVGAVIEPAAGPAVDISVVLDFCRQSLARYKVPERVLNADNRLLRKPVLRNTMPAYAAPRAIRRPRPCWLRPGPRAPEAQPRSIVRRSR